MTGSRSSITPSAPRGVLLALRLPRYRCRNKQGGDGCWRESVQLVNSALLLSLLNVMHEWLRREQIEATQVCLRTQAHPLTAGEGVTASRTVGWGAAGTRGGR